MFKKYRYFIYLLIIAFSILEACSASEIKINNLLIGSWCNIYKGNIILMGDSIVTIKFYEDTFYYSISYTTNDLTDGGRTAFGTYITEDSIVYLKGFWAGRNYAKAEDSLYVKIGKYERSYYYKFSDTNTLVLKPLRVLQNNLLILSRQ